MPILIVTAEGEGSRLDRYLRRQQFYFPQNLFEKWSRQGKLRLNDAKAKASSRVHEGDRIAFPDEAISLAPPEITTLLDISHDEAIKLVDDMRIFENEEILVVNKPSGLATQGGTGQRTSVDDILRAYSPDARFRLTHRIDKETSGLLIIAKTLAMATQLTNAFRDRAAEKTYIAVCDGIFINKEDIVDSPIGKSKEDFESMGIQGDYGREAITYYKVVSEENGVSVVELFPKTGRTHQLRVHMASLGHPIMGDKKYGGSPAKRLMLHAWKLSILGHLFEASLPKEFKI